MQPPLRAGRTACHPKKRTGVRYFGARIPCVAHCRCSPRAGNEGGFSVLIPQIYGSSAHLRVGLHLGISCQTITNQDAPLFRQKSLLNGYSSIFIHISGNTTYETAYASYHAAPLDIFTVDTGELYSINWDHREPYKHYAISFDNDLFDHIFEYETASRDAILSFLDHKKYPNLIRLPSPLKDELIALLNALDPLLGTNSSASIIQAFAHVASLFSLLYRAVSSNEAGSERPGMSALTEQTLRLLNEDFCNISSLNEVAHTLHVNSEYLSRQFRKDVGQSFKSYLLDKKLQHSRHLLKMGKNVTESALGAGFSNVSYFIQLYKKKYGVTPKNVEPPDANP